jgi:VanZ family protein
VNHARPILHPWRRALFATCVSGFSAAFIASHIPPQDMPDVHVTDKLLHAVGFAALTLTLLAALGAFGASRAKRLIATTLLLAAYGAVDELTQPFFGRTCDLHDWLADMLGMVLALAIVETITIGRKACCRPGEHE